MNYFTAGGLLLLFLGLGTAVRLYMFGEGVRGLEAGMASGGVPAAIALVIIFGIAITGYGMRQKG